MDPILLFLRYVDGLVVGWVTRGAEIALAEVVFYPLSWSGPAISLLDWSRDLAVGALAGAVSLAALAAVWPTLLRWAPPGPWSGLLVRAVFGVWVMASAPAVIAALLTLNNRVVGDLVRGPAAMPVAWSGGALAASPLLLLALIGVLAALVIYLSLLYVVRAVHVYWLAAWLPWAALGFVATGDAGVLWRPCRRLMALVFMQAAQAAGWWLTVRLVVDAASLGGMLVAAGGLWFLTRVPGEVARLGGERVLW